jgi:hypothetical protein
VLPSLPLQCQPSPLLCIARFQLICGLALPRATTTAQHFRALVSGSTISRLAFAAEGLRHNCYAWRRTTWAHD